MTDPEEYWIFCEEKIVSLQSKRFMIPCDLVKICILSALSLVLLTSEIRRYNYFIEFEKNLKF